MEHQTISQHPTPDASNNSVPSPSLAYVSDHVPAQVLATLHRPNPRIFWTDLFATAVLGWMAFAFAVANGVSSGIRVALTLVAAAAFYRGLCFLHEIVHVRRSALRGFETVWNILFGIPLFMPSIVYVGVHQNHHKLATYGTEDDPEYLPFGGKPALVGVFLLQSLFLPLLLAARFLVFSWFGLLVPPFHWWLARHCTALTMNVKYVRPVSASLMRTIKVQECMVLSGWGLAAILFLANVIPGRALAFWYAMAALLCLANTLRTLAAHRYRSDGTPLGREEQLRDSVDIPGGPWTELWAPVGLRYHATHHYYPGIPYHNLGAAHRYLRAALPTYAHSSENNLGAAFRSLLSAKTSSRHL